MNRKTHYRGIPLLPAAPLSAWLRSLPDDIEALDIERVTGVSARVVFELRKGGRAQVTLDTADRLLTLYAGEPALLNELYPLEA